MSISHSDPSALNGTTPEAAAQLWKHGVCMLPDAVDAAVLDACRRALERDHPELFSPITDPNRFYVSNGRFYTALEIHGPFARREILLPPAVERVLTASLGNEFVFDTFGIINALPGAAEQAWHRDGGILYGGHPLDLMVPASAVTVAIPLVEMNDETGTTGFALGSHRRATHVEKPDFEPVVPVGSALIWDFRVYHKGLTNRSTRARPLIFATCSRYWWADMRNHNQGRAEKLVIRRDALAQLDEPLRERLARARVVEG